MTTYNLLDIIRRDVPLKKVSAHRGGEYHGPCPFCGGTKRFRVQPERNFWRCRECEKHGDAIAYLVETGAMSPQEAGRARRGHAVRLQSGNYARRFAPPSPPSPTYPPDAAWQSAAFEFVALSQARLWSADGARARAYLHWRGLTEETISDAGLGFNTDTRIGDYGIVIPWFVAESLWKVNIRRPRGKPKYRPLKGGGNALYNADGLNKHLPAVMVEGELDAILIEQIAGDIVVPVATGAATHSRRPVWIAQLALCPGVLVVFDSDAAGEAAREYWRGVLRNTRTHVCPDHDATDLMLHRGPAAARAWIAAGVTELTARQQCYI